MMKKFIDDHIFRNVDSFSLGIFRAIFGGFMLIEMIVYQQTGFYKDSIIKPLFNFSYDYFGWLEPAAPDLMYAIHFIMAIAAIGIMLGFYSRIASGIFFVCFGYFMLCCRGHFNNHFYLFTLFSFLFMFVDGDRSFSIRKSEKLKEKIIPIWQLNLFKIQVLIVYFFGGVAKLNYDWIVLHQPMEKVLKNYGGDGFLSSELMVYFFTYGGLLFDLLVGFMLLFKRTRLLAVISVIFFNFSNAVIFDDIGIFPFVMLGTILLFYPPESKLIMKIKSIFVNEKKNTKKSATAAYSERSSLVLACVGVYFLFQCLMPLRHYALTENLIWTGISRNFSWHMKIQDRGMEEVSLIIIDKSSGEQIDYNYKLINTRINNLQIQTMVQTPSMVWQFANWLENRLNAELQRSKGRTFEDLEIYSRIKTSFNGREPQYIIDPHVDLTQVDYSPLKENTWMLPVENPDGK